MISLSQKAANRFNIKWKGLPEHNGDFWKIDMLILDRFPVLLIVHEYTLYTLVRRKSDYHSLDQIARDIRELCPWYRYTGEVKPGKNNDRKLNDSII